MSNDLLPEDISLESLHTMKGDMAKVQTAAPVPVPKKPIAQTLVETKIVEQKIPEAEIPDTTPIPSHLVRNLFITFLAVLIVAGSGYGILLVSKQRSAEPPVQPQITQQVKKELLSFNTSKLVAFQSIADQAKPDQEGVTHYETDISLPSMLAALSPTLPQELSRSFTGEDFFGGTPDGNFFIIKTDSPEQAYAAMLEWEKTMNNDLLPLFETDASFSVSSFKDRIILNKDVRVAVDSKERTLFLYGFYDSKTIVFAKNESVLRSVYEMLLRKNL